MEAKQSFSTELSHLLFGDMSGAYMTGALIFIALGAALMMYINVLQRDRDSDSTPYRFSWSFWISDNWWRLLANILVSFVVVRFFYEFTGISINMFFCLVIGITFDYVIVLLREFSYLVRKKMGAKLDRFREQNQLEKINHLENKNH